MSSVLQYILGNHISGNNSLSTAQLELLLCLSRQRVDITMEQAWTPVAGPLEQNIARFISDGLLEESPVADKIDAKYRVTEIREMLEERGIKAKGKKAEMIATLIGSMPREQAESLVADTRIFRLTAEGYRRIEMYQASRDKARKEMETDSIALLVKGDVRKAWSRIARFYEGQFMADPKWSRPMPGVLACEAAHLVRMPYDDLPMAGSQRSELGAQLALSVLLGEPIEEAGKRMVRYVGDAFDLTQALAFHRPNPCGHGSPTDNVESLAGLYATTRIQEALSACELSSLKTSKLGKGIKVLPVHGSDCSLCHGGKFFYSWSELEQLPKLPRQIGCHCTYAAWL